MPRINAKSSPISEAVNRRFFVALERMVQLNKVSALESFCVENKLSSSRYREMRLQYGVTPTGKVSRYKNIEIEAIYALVANFPISAEWLVTGRGEMVKPQRKQKATYKAGVTLKTKQQRRNAAR